MAFLEIPLAEVAEQTFRMNLDGQATRFRVYWTQYPEHIQAYTETQGCWFIDITNNIMKLSGVALVCGIDLTDRFSFNEFGNFAMFDTEGDEEGDKDPDFEGFGKRWRLVYATF